jgi:hypothetical protein
MSDDTMREVVVGYDVRTSMSAPDPLWTDDRRREYLLKDVARPLSVDEATWTRPGTTMKWGEGITVETPKYAKLADALAAAGPDDTVIAITQWQGLAEPQVGPLATPSGTDRKWEILGWDICDRFFPSGLSNCGYGPDRDAWAAQWSEHLNRHHLFDHLPVAFAFRDRTNRRIPEHAPFLVLGLYRVR